MPKIKTSRSAAKRFSTTGSGKFRRRRQNLRHILTKKDANVVPVWARVLSWTART